MPAHQHHDDLTREHAKRVALQHHACDQSERVVLEQENAELRATAKALAAHVEALEGFAP
jgi:cell division protein FtsB